MKKILAILTALSLLALTACSSGGANVPNSESPKDYTGEGPVQSGIVSGDGSAVPTEETEQDEEKTSAPGALDGNAHHKIDSDILELYYHTILSLPEERFVYNENGFLESVLTTNYKDETYNNYEFFYDDSGRVEEIREYSGYATEPVMIYTFKRNAQGDKIQMTTQLIQSDGSYAITGYMVIEYDDVGHRIYDYWYTSDRVRQDNYTAYLYNESGLRVEQQSRKTDTDEVLSNEVYAYNESGQITDVYTYYAGSLSLHQEYIYDADGFQYMNQYDASGNNIGKGYDMLLPGNLYELIHINL